MKLLSTFGVYFLYETADRDGPIYQVHIGVPPTKLNEVHRGTNSFWAVRIARSLAATETGPPITLSKGL